MKLSLIVCSVLFAPLFFGCATAVDHAPAPTHAAPQTVPVLRVNVDPSLFVDAEVDPRLEVPVRAALGEWTEKTGLQFRITVQAVPAQELKHGVFRFAVGHEFPNLAVTQGDPATRTTNVTMDLDYYNDLGWLTPDDLRIAVLHETGHALGLSFGGDDPFHYFGDEPSVMHTEVVHCAPHLGKPELAEYFSLYERSLP